MTLNKIESSNSYNKELLDELEKRINNQEGIFLVIGSKYSLSYLDDGYIDELFISPLKNGDIDIFYYGTHTYKTFTEAITDKIYFGKSLLEISNNVYLEGFSKNVNKENNNVFEFKSFKHVVQDLSKEYDETLFHMLFKHLLNSKCYVPVKKKKDNEKYNFDYLINNIIDLEKDNKLYIPLYITLNDITVHEDDVEYIEIDLETVVEYIFQYEKCVGIIINPGTIDYVIDGENYKTIDHKLHNIMIPQPIELIDKILLEIDPKDIVAFHIAEGGAMGEPNGFHILTKDMTLYHTNLGEEKVAWDILTRKLPILKRLHLFMGTVEGLDNEWYHLYLGFGNCLVVKSEYREIYYNIVTNKLGTNYPEPSLYTKWYSFFRSIEKEIKDINIGENNMVTNIEEFFKQYPKCNIVNYDMANKFDCGLLYRHSTEHFEKLRKDKSGKYIIYPQIQPYLNLETSAIDLFIIKDNKMYKLRKGNTPQTYKYDYLLDNVDVSIFEDLFFGGWFKAEDPYIIGDQPIYEIEE